MNEIHGKTTQGVYSLLDNIINFTAACGGFKMRGYQEEVAEAVMASVTQGKGMSFVVMFPRQSGKNEIQAHIEAYLLTLFQNHHAEMVKISPTWKPQTQNAMRRLERVLTGNSIARYIWKKEAGYMYRIADARIFFLSGSPETNIVGATANLLLQVDEAQDIRIAKYDKDIAPMASSTNATRVFWGTAWTSATLLARELRAARRAEKKRRHETGVCCGCGRSCRRGAGIRRVCEGTGKKAGAQPPDGKNAVFC